MNVVAIIGILKAVNELALTVRGIKDQWKKDNPGEPLPAELEDATLIEAFRASIEGASQNWDQTIARLQARVDAGQ